MNFVLQGYVAAWPHCCLKRFPLRKENTCVHLYKYMFQLFQIEWGKQWCSYFYNSICMKKREMDREENHEQKVRVNEWIGERTQQSLCEWDRSSLTNPLGCETIDVGTGSNSHTTNMMLRNALLKLDVMHLGSARFINEPKFGRNCFYLAVKAQDEQHEEEKCSPEWRQRHQSHGLWVGNKGQARTCILRNS